MTNLPQELNKLNFSLITIRFHPTDMESFDFFYKSIFLPNFVFKCPIYCGTIEYDKTLDRHLHFVLGYTRNEWTENDKLRTKLNSMKNYKVLNIKNTEFEGKGINCKTLNKYTPDTDENNEEENKKNFLKSVAVLKSIGYCLKEDNKNYITNLSDKDLETAYQSYIFTCKKPIGTLKHIDEHKILSIGNVRSYMYDTFMEDNFDIGDLPLLESYMIQHKNVSFVKISKQQKSQVLKELELKVTNDKMLYKNFKTDTEEFLDQSLDIEAEYDGYINPKSEMIKEIIYLRKKLQLQEKKNIC